MHLERSLGGPAKSPLQKYDALQDKFASFYFNGHGVKKHLKKLRKVMELQPRRKGYREYSEMLNQKLNELEVEEQNLKFRIKPYQQSLKPASLQKLKKMQNFFQDTTLNEHSSITHNQPIRREIPLFNNLPKISKSNQNISRNTQIPLQSSLEKEKDKSISMADQLSRSVYKAKKLPVNRDRSQRFLQLNKSSLFNKQPEIAVEEELKQVKHDQFVNFLKKRQQELLGTAKGRIKSEAIPEAIQ